jgi:hypothetical protein
LDAVICVAGGWAGGNAAKGNSFTCFLYWRNTPMSIL